MTETRLQYAIQKEVTKRGGFVFKVHGSEYMMSGLPDLIVCYKGQFIGMETKTPENKKPVPVQSLRKKQIRESGGRSETIRSLSAAIELLKSVEESSAKALLPSE
ncbi:MAG: VRR-NUC domain-containing protein [Gloeomargaritales cyanobacterium]